MPRRDRPEVQNRWIELTAQTKASDLIKTNERFYLNRPYLYGSRTMKETGGQPLARMSMRSPLRRTRGALPYVGEVDGKIVVQGGLARRGPMVRIPRLTDEARAYKMHLMRWARRVIEEARSTGVRFIYVEPDANEPKAKAWLTRLGFEQDPACLALAVARRGWLAPPPKRTRPLARESLWPSLDGPP